MWKFERLCFDPAKRFKILQEEIIFGKLGWQLDVIITASLRNPSHSLSHERLDSSPMHRVRNHTFISFTCLLSAGDIPYRKAATCVLRSAAVMNARKMFFGRT